MKRIALLGAGFALLAVQAQAQQGAALNDSQREGQRLFLQHCGVCHLKIQINVAAPNGPLLSKAVFDNGGDDRVRVQIADGSPNMPGYKLMFTPAQIDSIADYIKTMAPAPAAPAKR